jgi:RNA-directed DNA polymerase
MTEQPRTRQDLYDLIRQTSKQEFILAEMIRLGLWDADAVQAEDDPAEEIKRRGELQREINALSKENRLLGNEAAMKKQMLKQRLEASKQKQKETKERNEQKRLDRIAAWNEKQQHEITRRDCTILNAIPIGSNKTISRFLKPLKISPLR